MAPRAMRTASSRDEGNGCSLAFFSVDDDEEGGWEEAQATRVEVSALRWRWRWRPAAGVEERGRKEVEEVDEEVDRGSVERKDNEFGIARGVAAAAAAGGAATAADRCGLDDALKLFELIACIVIRDIQKSFTSSSLWGREKRKRRIELKKSEAPFGDRSSTRHTQKNQRGEKKSLVKKKKKKM